MKTLLALTGVAAGIFYFIVLSDFMVGIIARGIVAQLAGL